MENTKKKELLTYIIFLQTIGPIFVILGHSINGLPYHTVFNSIKLFIYVFHMPLFFFISGLTFYYSNNEKKIKYFDYIKKKAVRLLIPYVFWNLLFLVPKYILSAFLNDKVQLSIAYVFKVFLYPRNNICGTTWFLVALFIMYAVAPLLLKIFQKKKILYYMLLLLAFVMSMFYIDNRFLTIGDLSKDLVFFMLGLCIFSNKEKLLKIKNEMLLIIACLISFIFWVIYSNKITTAFLCTFILLLLLIIGLIGQKKWKRNIISDNGLFIMIFHWFFILATRIVVYQILHFNYYITVLLMLTAGIVGPIISIKIIDKFKLREKSKFLSIILG